MNLQLKWVEHNSADYLKSVALRDLVLRQPLNMVFTDEQLAAEKDEYHLIGVHNNVVVACLVLKPKSKTQVQMRQVAVYPEYQNQGLGSSLVAESERKAKELRMSIMFLHARDTAVPFYEKLDYKIHGEPFVEVGITHFEMIKKLD